MRILLIFSRERKREREKVEESDKKFLEDEYFIEISF